MEFYYCLPVVHSVQAKCTLSNDELKCYDKIEDMHSSNDVANGILSMEKMMKTCSFYKCKEGGDVFKFCRAVQ